ncbi:hypothetical protein EDC01DRAFT_789147 [Geopyxis carbonaria]|nr:hypothetical protein EDC01DRAFT_789147 [Geopyxis carbonaria]
MPDPPQRSGLYASLLGNTTTPASISKAPVVFSKPGAAPADSAAAAATPEATAASAQKKINAAALRFQPTITKRPTPAQPKAKPKTGGASGFKPKAVVNAAPTEPVVKTSIDDWVGDDDVNGFYSAQPKERARGGRKKRKKNKATPPPPTNWDDTYDPMRPNSYEEYRDGDEKIREMQDWRERLYGKKRRRDSFSSSDDEPARKGAANRFAPPANYSFAPPPQFANQGTTVRSEDVAPPPPPPAVAVPDDASGEDAFARRMRMSQQGAVGYSATSAQPPPPPPPPPPVDTYTPPPATTTGAPGTVPTPPPPPPAPAATISAAPVLYTNQPRPASPEPAPARSPSPEPDQPNSRQSFAQRLLEKQGWVAGRGLGRDGRGITKAIQMVAAKGKGNAGRGKIIDKNKRPTKPAERSEVVVLRGAVDGWRGEVDDGEMMQRVGEVYKRYGRVVQIVIRWDEPEGEQEEVEGGRARVYVLFASEDSAQMAVNGLQRKEVFEGNTTTAMFYPKEKFEAMELE